ncbi:MAG: 3-keto-5-aminohexanoate cleavage enzyme, partial [Pseudoalteromonas tetraodonis]
GHARVGFENNLWLPTGELVPDNQTLIAQVVDYARTQGRQVATAQQARLILGISLLPSVRA